MCKECYHRWGCLELATCKGKRSKDRTKISFFTLYFISDLPGDKTYLISVTTMSGTFRLYLTRGVQQGIYWLQAWTRSACFFNRRSHLQNQLSWRSCRQVSYRLNLSTRNRYPAHIISFNVSQATLASLRMELPDDILLPP